MELVDADADAKIDPESFGETDVIGVAEPSDVLELATDLYELRQQLTP